jgi:transposase
MKLNRICNVNYAAAIRASDRHMACIFHNCSARSALYCGIFPLTTVLCVRVCGIIHFTYTMPPDPPAKRQALQATGTFNPRADQVHHPLFQQSSFFDPEDLLQLKYETLRALQTDHCPVAQAARDFGLSRPTIYEAQAQFELQGLEGLLPRKRGPKSAHKLTDPILQYLREQTAAQPDVGAEELARQVHERYAVQMHPRTIQKALKAKAKGGRPT